MEAIVLAGGYGTRLAAAVPGLPKVLAPVGERPFLDYVLSYLRAEGVTRAVLATGHLREQIAARYAEGFPGLQILFSPEESPLLTGGAIKRALRLVSGERAFAVNGDTLFRVPLRRMEEDFLREGADISLSVRKMRNCARYGTVRVGEGRRVLGFREKAAAKDGYINGGVYLIGRGALDECPERFSFEAYLAENRIAKTIAFPCSGFFLDIGVPEDYQRAGKLLAR